MKNEILPRLIRQRDAARYCGMDVNRFNSEVRPHLVEIPIGKQGIAFDRLDLDAWVDQYKGRNGRPGKAMKGEQLWDRKSRQDLSKGVTFGTSKRKSDKQEFFEALAQATSRKR